MDNKLSTNKDRYSSNNPLSNKKVQTILEQFLIKGLHIGIRFSEFEKELIPEIFKHKKDLQRHLDYLIRDEILYQEEKKKPYFLRDNYHQITIQKYIGKIITSFSTNQIYSDNKYPIYSHAIYGFDPGFLTPKEYEELEETKKNLKEIMAKLHRLKRRWFGRYCRYMYNQFYSQFSKILNTNKSEFISRIWSFIVVHSLYISDETFKPNQNRIYDNENYF